MNFEEHKIERLNYVVRYPDSYEAEKSYPVIILLHGAGGRGQDIDVLKENPYFKITGEIPEFPFVSVAPLCSENTWFDLFEPLKKLVHKISEEKFCDKRRIYLMGASMGGYGTWQLAMSMPEYFAAIIPICGGGMYWNAARLVNVPAWAFHGKKDTVVSVEESEKMVQAINRSGGTAKVTVYDEADHDAWSSTYANAEVFDWLLHHENTNLKEIEDKYHDSEIYG